MEIPDKTGLVYGINVVSSLIEGPSEEIDKIYFSREASGRRLFTLRKECRKKRLPSQSVPEKKLDQLTGRANHQGVAAQRPLKPYLPLRELLALCSESPTPLLFLPAHIEDPRNLGACIRSAAAFGVTAMLLEEKNAVPLTGAVAKSAAGALERMPLCRPHNLGSALATLREGGITIVAAEASATTPLWEADLTGPLCIVTGGEHRAVPPTFAPMSTGGYVFPRPPAPTPSTSRWRGVSFFTRPRGSGITDRNRHSFLEKEYCAYENGQDVRSRFPGKSHLPFLISLSRLFTVRSEK